MRRAAVLLVLTCAVWTLQGPAAPAAQDAPTVAVYNTLLSW